MPINSVPYQPSTGQLLAAYRPIVFQVQATATGGGALPPYAVCDIYIADIYYKSIIRTAAESTTDIYSIYQFDISDALQEYLQPDIATLNNNNVLQAPHMSAKVFCRFRTSDVDADGFTVEEPTKPVQGTKNTDPVAGTGTQSNTFFVINSALQHEDNQNLLLHLTAYKQGIWANNAFPLTHRNKYYFCDNDSDHFPMIFTGDCISADLLLNYRLKGQTSFQVATAQDINACAGITFVTEVTGNRVDVSLDEAVPADQSVLVQYKKQADSVWIDAGTFTTQDFFFNINGDDIAGDYDIRIIHFCTPCLSSDPELGTFTLDGSSVNLAWRGINPFCVVQTFETPIYIQLEIRNPDTATTDYPDSENPESRTTITSGELWAKFFSDSALLNPLTVNQNGLKVFIKTRATNNNTYTYGSSNNIIESVNTYIVNAAGTEVLLGNVNTQLISESYNPYPTVESSSNSTYVFFLYPDTEILVGGNTGFKGYSTLQEYNTDTNIPTGNTKPNDSGDPDYIAPVSDTTTCPNGPDVSTVSYGYGLEVFGVRIYVGPYTFISNSVSNTTSGGWNFCFPVPKNTNTNIAVRGRTLDSGNTTGHFKCRVSYIDGGGNYQSAEFNIDHNIDTYLPQTFQNITNINVSNY
jgi:hypothetical protein